MKEAFYFSHDYNARNDQKILTLRWEFWLEWYALYFMMIESMAEEPDGYINRGAIVGLWVSYGVAKEKLLAFIEKWLEIGIFLENEHGIFSKRMVEHKEYRKSLSEQGKLGAEKRWKNGGAIATPMQRKGKERKIKETDTSIFTDFIGNPENESATFYLIKNFLLLWWNPSKEETIETIREWMKEVFKENEVEDSTTMKKAIDIWYEYWKEEKKPKNVKSTFRSTIKFSIPWKKQ